MDATSSSNRVPEIPQEEQPEPRIHSAPDAMRNLEGVSHKAQPPFSITSEFIGLLTKDYPSLSFKSGKQEHWSPKTKTIFFNPSRSCYGVLHELAHALLDHTTYQTDFELLRMESDAWEMAIKIGEKYKIKIEDEHVQNCLDTYRDWLHRRSTCPSCGTHVLQSSSNDYQCYNCQTCWHVSSGRFVRPYRKITNEKTAQ